MQVINRLSGEIELLSTQAQMDQLQIAKDLDADNIARLKTQRNGGRMDEG